MKWEGLERGSAQTRFGVGRKALFSEQKRGTKVLPLIKRATLARCEISRVKSLVNWSSGLYLVGWNATSYKKKIKLYTLYPPPPTSTLYDDHLHKNHKISSPKGNLCSKTEVMSLVANLTVSENSNSCCSSSG